VADAAAKLSRELGYHPQVTAMNAIGGGRQIHERSGEKTA